MGNGMLILPFGSNNLDEKEKENKINKERLRIINESLTNEKNELIDLNNQHELLLRKNIGLDEENKQLLVKSTETNSKFNMLSTEIKVLNKEKIELANDVNREKKNKVRLEKLVEILMNNSATRMAELSINS